MDMKKMLQAIDGVATKPVAGVNDMAKFLRLVSEADINQPAVQPTVKPTVKPTAQPVAATAKPKPRNDWTPEEIVAILSGEKTQAQVLADRAAKGQNEEFDNGRLELNEGTNPHKVTLPVQMAMQQYQKPAIKKESVVRKYFEQVQEETLQHQTERKQLIQQYAQRLSQRVLENRRYSSFYNPMDYERDEQRQMDYDKREFKRQEMEHELGHEDEYERKHRAKPKVVAWIFYNVTPENEHLASMYKIRQLKNGKWAMPEYDISGRTYAFQRNQADKIFGKGKRWEPKN